MSPAEQIRELLTEACHLIKQADEKCYDNLNTGATADIIGARSLAAACISKYSAAESTYWAHPELEDSAFLKVIRQFKRVSREADIVFDGSKNLSGFHIELMYLEDLLNNR